MNTKEESLVAGIPLAALLFQEMFQEELQLVIQ